MGLRLEKRPFRVANIIEEGKLGGPQIRIMMAAASMKERVDTTVIMPIENSERFRDRCDAEGIEYIAMPISRITTEWRVAIRYLLFSIFEIVRIVRFLKQEKFDLIHVSGGSWQYKGVIAGKLAGIKVVWHLNDTSMPALFRRLFSIISRYVDGFIFASQRSKEYYGTLVTRKVPEFVVPAPVDTAAFSPTSVTAYSGGLIEQLRDKVVVGTVANVNPVKGLEYLVQAAAQINNRNRDVCFIVVGAIYKNQTKYYDKLQVLAAKLSADNILFLGAQSDIKGLLKIMDIYLCSSVAESSPIAVWEAMAMVKPIVSTDVGDVPIYIEDGMNGYVVDVGDIDKMTERLSLYIEDRYLRQEHGARAREVSVNNLDVRLCAERHIEAYSAFVPGPPSEKGHAD